MRVGGSVTSKVGVKPLRWGGGHTHLGKPATFFTFSEKLCRTSFNLEGREGWWASPGPSTELVELKIIEKMVGKRVYEKGGIPLSYP